MLPSARVECTERLVPANALARVRRQPSEDGSQCALCPIFSLARRAAAAQVGQQIVLLLLVAGSCGGGVPEELAGSIVDLAAADVCRTVRSVNVFGNSVPAIPDVAALAEYALPQG